MDLRLGATIAVIGAGPIGEMALRWAVASGARHVVAVDGFASRSRRHAEAVRRPWDPTRFPSASVAIAEACGGAPEIVIDSTGNAAVFTEALQLAADGGRVVLLGDNGSPQVERLTPDVITRGVRGPSGPTTPTAWGVRSGTATGSLHDLFLDLVRRGRFDVSDLNSHTFAPTDCVEAYDSATNQAWRHHGHPVRLGTLGNPSPLYPTVRAFPSGCLVPAGGFTFSGERQVGACLIGPRV